jgi:Peptidase A4 family
MGHSRIPEQVPTPSCVGLCRKAFVAVVAGLAFAPVAIADSTDSTNWAGYAAHGASYRQVQGSWVEPGATCSRGVPPTYSSYWVGIGGYSQSSQALEQIGTEVDCASGGRTTSDAWYELVPAPSIPIGLTVKAGDVLQANVSISGSSVTLQLYDATRRQGFKKVVRAPVLDLTSAEWIVEAPSDCVSANSCQSLPLANFGSAAFSSAAAQTSAGRTGGITNSAWQTTKINLRPSGRRFVVNTPSGPIVGGATASPLSASGTSFTVSYSPILVPGTVGFGPRVPALRAADLVHPGR